MADILKFEQAPDKELKELLEALDKGFDAMEEQYTKLVQIEQSIDDLQALYNIRYQEYIKKVGMQNVPQEYQDYASTLIPTNDGMLVH